MAITTTPLGFQLPDGAEPVRQGDNVIAANGQKAQDLLAVTESRLGQLEFSAGFVTSWLAPAAGPEPLAGAADNSTALNAQLAANAGGLFALKPARTYVCNSVLNVPDGTTFDLNGATLDFTGMANGTALGQRYGIRADGSLGSQVAVAPAGALVKWSKVITGIASTAGFAAGDTVLLSSDEDVVPGMDLDTRDKAELNTILSVDSGSQVTLTHGLIFDYALTHVMPVLGTVSTNLNIRKMNPVKKVTIKNGTLKMRGVGSAHNGIQFEYARNVMVDNIHVDGAEDCSVGFKATLNGTMKNSTAINATSSATLGPTGYGVCVWDASRHIKIDNNYFENNRHHVAGGGIWPAVFVRVSNNAGRKSLSASYDCHEPCHYWAFTKNTAEVGTHGFFVRGQYVTLEGNTVSDISQEAYAIHPYNSVTEQRGIRIINNIATHCGYGISVGKASGETVEPLSYDLEIVGNTLNDCGTNPIRVRYFDGAKVSGNAINGGASAAIFLEGPSASLPSKNLTAMGNTITGHGSFGIYVKYFEGAKVSGNTIVGGTAEGIFCEGDGTTKSKWLTLDGNDVRSAGTNGIMVKNCDDLEMSGGLIISPTNHGVYLLTCTRAAMSNVKVRTPAQYGVYIDGGAAHTLTGVHVSGGAGSTYDSLRVVGVTGLNVSGGYYASPRYGIFTTTTTPVLVVGAYVKDTVHGTKINCDAATQTLASNMV